MWEFFYFIRYSHHSPIRRFVADISFDFRQFCIQSLFDVMTVYLKKLSILTLFLMAATSADADLVPKKLWEFDFKEKMGFDLRSVDNQTMHFGGRYSAITEYEEASIIFSAYSVEGKRYGFWAAGNNNVYDISKFYDFQMSDVIFMSTKLLIIYESRYNKLTKLENKNGDLHFRETNLSNVRTSLGEYMQNEFVKIVATNGNNIICYDPINWVESEGGEGENSEPQIMFSKITPNEITIKGDTIKGGTIERSTDLKNWKRLMKINKGGFDVFVDPAEKNKEFFRVKSE